MFIKFVNFSTVNALAFENGRGIVQGMTQNMQLGVSPRDEFSVKPNGTVASIFL